MAERGLAGEAHEHVEPGRDDGQESDRYGDVEVVGVGGDRSGTSGGRRRRGRPSRAGRSHAPRRLLAEQPPGSHDEHEDHEAEAHDLPRARVET